MVHNECNSDCQCVEKPGRAIDQCALGSNCTQPICLKRNVCDANKRCVAIDCLQGGTTGDDCNVVSDCTDTAYHGECAKVGEACKCNQVLGGNIESQCSANADCSTSPVCMKKNVCVGQSCVSQNCLSSEGCTSNCTATSQCCLAGNHTECNYESKQCVCAPGVDVNECDTNGECIQRKECKSAFIGIYGGNWEVSDTCVSLDNAEGGAPCVNTTQCLLNFTAPYVNNLVIGTAPYCTGISEIGTVPISWQYNHTEGKSQKQFTIQIDDNSDFSSPEVNMSWLTSYSNSQLIQVRNTPTISGTYNSGDYITYNVDYYVRVRVQDQDGVYSLWTYYDSTNNGTTDEGAKTIYKFPYAHPAPSIDFDYAPIKIMPSDPVVFTNRSFCYGGNCTSILWNFGDGSTDAETWSPTHTYDEKGDYIVGLKVCDNSGVSIECCFSNPKVVPVDIQTGQDLPIFKEVSPQ